MNIKQAIEIVEYHNKWRRGEYDNQVYSAKEIGIAIDTLLAHVLSDIIMPCPFCGSCNIDNNGIIEGEEVQCMDCGATAESLEAWNMRV